MKENENKQNIFYFDTDFGLLTAKESIYQKANYKLDLFESCINEVGLYKSFPFLDISFKIRILNKVIPSKLKNFPLDDTEHILMKNCVRRNLDNLRSIKLLNSN